jgi:hypothetical protein
MYDPDPLKKNWRNGCIGYIKNRVFRNGKQRPAIKVLHQPYASKKVIDGRDG